MVAFPTYILHMHACTHTKQYLKISRVYLYTCECKIKNQESFYHGNGYGLSLKPFFKTNTLHSHIGCIIKHNGTVIRKCYDGNSWTLFWMRLGKCPIKMTVTDISGKQFLQWRWFAWSSWRGSTKEGKKKAVRKKTITDTIKETGD